MPGQKYYFRSSGQLLAVDGTDKGMSHHHRLEDGPIGKKIRPPIIV